MQWSPPSLSFGLPFSIIKINRALPAEGEQLGPAIHGRRLLLIIRLLQIIFGLKADPPPRKRIHMLSQSSGSKGGREMSRKRYTAELIMGKLG